MKTITFSKQFAKVLALLLAIVMLFTACGGSEEPADPDAVSDASTTETVSNDATDATDATDANSKKNDSTGNKQQTQNNGGTTNQQQTQNTTTTKKKTTFDKNVYGDIPASVKAKDVHILMWREYRPTEKKLIDDFTKKTGIKVRTTLTTEKEYATKMISLIAGKDSPDCVQVNTKMFPGVAVRALTPLDPSIYRLDDSCWNKTVMKNFAHNGNYYSVAMPKSWECDDTIFVNYYLKSVLKESGVTTTPWELYQQGKWNWNTLKDIALKVGGQEGYVGYSMQSYDMFMYSTGESFVKYDGKQYTNNMDSKTVLKAWNTLCTLADLGVTSHWDKLLLQSGKVGMFSAYTYNMWTEADSLFANVVGGFENIEAVPIAGESQSKAYVPSISKSWGRCKGSKNPEGAAYFLRYWLDVSNFNHDSTFVNKQCKKVFDILTDSKTKKIITIDEGVIDYTATGNYSEILFVWPKPNRHRLPPI